MRNIEQRLRMILKEVDHIDKAEADTVDVQANLVNELGLDSLDSIELVMAVEDEFGVGIDDDVAEKFTSLQDVVTHLLDEGVSNDEVFGYPPAKPIVTLPARIPTIQTAPYVVVLYDTPFEVSGKGSEAFTDVDAAEAFVHQLGVADIFAQAYDLVPR